VGKSAICAAVPAESSPIAPAPGSDGHRDLLELLAGISDGRSGQGRDHPVAAVLALATAATVAGMKGYTAIAGWVADVPPGVLAGLYPRAARTGPDAATSVIAAQAEVGKNTNEVPMATVVLGRVDLNGKVVTATHCTP